MSDGSYAKIRPEPLQNIGAQDLLSVGYQFYGFLRKKRRWDNLTGSSKWKQRFVVLSEGCLYCFNHESSTKPMAAFSLCFYENAFELHLKIPHCFQITHEDASRAPLIFSCESEDRRRTWIAHVRDCIEQCGQRSASSLNLSDQSIDEGIVADKALERPGRRSKNLPLPPLPNEYAPQAPQKAKRYKETARSEYDLESEEEDEYDDDDALIYDDISEEESQAQAGATASTSKAQTLPRMGIPVLPSREELGYRPASISWRPPVPLPGKSKKKEPTVEEKEADSSDRVNIFQSKDYQFDSNDREQAKNECLKDCDHDLMMDHYLKCCLILAVRELTLSQTSPGFYVSAVLLVGKQDGTFLIRKSRSSASQVLSVVAHREVKEFQITEDGVKMSIDKTMFFPTLSSLLDHYYHNDLPKSDYKVKLKRGCFNR